MNKEQYEQKRLKNLEKAREIKAETAVTVDKAVDSFFAEQAEKRANYVPQKLITKQLPVGLYVIRWEDGSGVIPEVLSGIYTTLHQANKAINLYLSVRDAKTNSD